MIKRLLLLLLVVWFAEPCRAQMLLRHVGGPPVIGSLPTVASIAVNGVTSENYQTGIASGTSLGPISVTMSDGSSFDGTLSLGGTNCPTFPTNCFFGLSSTSLPSNLQANSQTPTCSVVTNFGINIIATAGAGESGGPFSQTITLTCNPGTITGLTLSGATYPASSGQGTVIGSLQLTGTNNSNTTFALSGPDAARFQLSSPCTGAACSLQASGTEPDGYHDGLFHVFIKPTLAGAKGSGVVYPFEVAELPTCSSTSTIANLSSTISSASNGQTICVSSGSGTISSGITVSHSIRVTGLTAGAVAAAGSAWYSAVPNITFSGASILAFNVTVGGAQFDHLKATASATLATNNTGGSCGGGTTYPNLINASVAFTGLTVAYVQTSNFMCDYVFGGGTTSTSVTNVSTKYNLSTGAGYAAMTCDPCTSATWSNNQNFNMTVDTGSGNSYPFVFSGDALSTTATVTNNTVVNNTVWTCYNQHGNTDIVWTSNYGLACNAQATQSGIANMTGIGGTPATATRPRWNSNFLDQGTGAFTAGFGSIVQVAGSGGTLTCGTTVGVNDCEVENNTVLGFLDNSSCTQIIVGADGGTLTGTQTVSGNSCSGTRATMAAPTFAVDAAGGNFLAGQANGLIGKISVVMTPAFPAWVGGWPNYGGWPGTFSICEGSNCTPSGTTTTHFQICVDGQHVCQVAAGVPAGSYTIRVAGALNGLSNSPQTSANISLTGS